MPYRNIEERNEKQRAYAAARRLAYPDKIRAANKLNSEAMRRRRGIKPRNRPSPKIGRIDRLDLIALQDPTIAKGRPPLDNPRTVSSEN